VREKQKKGQKIAAIGGEMKDLRIQFLTPLIFSLPSIYFDYFFPLIPFLFMSTLAKIGVQLQNLLCSGMMVDFSSHLETRIW